MTSPARKSVQRQARSLAATLWLGLLCTACGGTHIASSAPRALRLELRFPSNSSGSLAATRTTALDSLVIQVLGERGLHEVPLLRETVSIAPGQRDLTVRLRVPLAERYRIDVGAFGVQQRSGRIGPSGYGLQFRGSDTTSRSVGNTAPIVIEMHNVVPLPIGFLDNGDDPAFARISRATEGTFVTLKIEWPNIIGAINYYVRDSTSSGSVVDSATSPSLTLNTNVSADRLFTIQARLADSTLGAQSEPLPFATLPPVLDAITEILKGGTGPVDVGLSGSGFIPEAVVTWNGAELPTTVLNSDSLRATVSRASLAVEGIAEVRVRNPSGLASGTALAIVAAAGPPRIAALEPDSIYTGPGVNIVVDGDGFYDGAAVVMNGERLVTTLVSPTQLEAFVPPSLVAQPITAAIQVANIDGQVSGSYSLRVFQNPWQLRASMPTARSDLAAATEGAIIYAIGGRDVRGLDVVEAYDPTTDSWSARARIPNSRYDLGLVANSGALYAVGGYPTPRETPYADTLQIFNTTTGAWSRGASMPTARDDLAVGIINGTIVAAGGILVVAPRVVGVTEVYDIQSDTWTSAPPMTATRAGAASAVVDGHLYVIGGADSLSASSPSGRVEAYDPIARAWALRATMPTPRLDCAAGVVNGIIYVFGGSRTMTFETTTVVEAYDPQTNRWTTMTPMPIPLQGQAVSSVNGRLYIVGGSSNVTALSTVYSYDPAADILRPKPGQSARP